MRIVLAPDSFKGSLTAVEAAAAMAAGVQRVDPGHAVVCCPVSDGGEGFVDAIVVAADGMLHDAPVLGPRGQPRRACWGWLPDRTAVVEAAAASGLVGLSPTERDPWLTTSFGTGQLMAQALDEGCDKLIVGLGGSATNDGGAGMAQALGARFYDRHETLLEAPLTGGTLDRIARVDVSEIHPRLASVEVVVACDVTNPLVGPRGASAVYGPQKGASPETLVLLDRNLGHLAQIMQAFLKQDVADTPGAGAAGGLGGGLLAFCNARLVSGIELVLDTIDFSAKVQGATLCLTGEGRLDGQSLEGKAILGVAKAAGRQGVPTVALVGSFADDAAATLDAGLHAFYSIASGLPLEQAMSQAAKLLSAATEACVRAWPLPPRGGDNLAV